MFVASFIANHPVVEIFLADRAIWTKKTEQFRLLAECDRLEAALSADWKHWESLLSADWTPIMFNSLWNHLQPNQHHSSPLTTLDITLSAFTAGRGGHSAATSEPTVSNVQITALTTERTVSSGTNGTLSDSRDCATVQLYSLYCVTDSDTVRRKKVYDGKVYWRRSDCILKVLRTVKRLQKHTHNERERGRERSSRMSFVEVQKM